MRNAINRFVNISLFWTFCLLMGAGLVLKFRLADEYPYPSGTAILGLGWKDWAQLHFLLGMTMIFLVVIHLYMNRKWLLKIAAGFNRGILLGGLIIGLLLIGIPFFAPEL